MFIVATASPSLERIEVDGINTRMSLREIKSISRGKGLKIRIERDRDLTVLAIYRGLRPTKVVALSNNVREITGSVVQLPQGRLGRGATRAEIEQVLGKPSKETTKNGELRRLRYQEDSTGFVLDIGFKNARADYFEIAETLR